ncbi:uncharacterized protein RHTO_04508 [Rhodotorula toruloides NP11]|uniref:Uncharacterized protein n=1 Tax=Rhodotorula toruloides (strain NP11) TaxID=1130832 RepID=M7WMN8_RHOT1|nr:uncharacterized protein RHTO_04508 [Rhodotorula toruloides NP11]EMS19316.1 hypothetical protein RHTO_04508 [Rhodotorula toruloides NP11]
MTIVLGLSPTNMAFADKLDQLLLRGTLSDIQEELHRPTSSVADCARLSKRCTTSALSILDSSTSYGTLVVGCAALARRSFAFRLACFSMILERGANPFARGTDGRAVSWILDGIKNSAERQCFEEELQAAQKAWKSSEKYEMALDIREWIEDSLAVMEEEKREAFKQSKREAFVQSPQEIEPAVAERAPTPTPPPGKRPRLESPAPEKLPSSQNESLPDYDEVVTGSKTELVEPKLPPPEPTPVTGEPAPPKHQDETPAPPGQASQAPSTVPVSAVPPTGAPSTSSRLSRLPPGVVQGPQVQPKPSSQPSTSRLPPPPPPPLAPDTLTPVAPLHQVPPRTSRRRPRPRLPLRVFRRRRRAHLLRKLCRLAVSRLAFHPRPRSARQLVYLRRPPRPPRSRQLRSHTCLQLLRLGSPRPAVFHLGFSPLHRLNQLQCVDRARPRQVLRRRRRRLPACRLAEPLLQVAQNGRYPGWGQQALKLLRLHVRGQTR